jgi:hypothetical protein
LQQLMAVLPVCRAGSGVFPGWQLLVLLVLLCLVWLVQQGSLLPAVSMLLLRLLLLWLPALPLPAFLHHLQENLQMCMDTKHPDDLALLAAAPQ